MRTCAAMTPPASTPAVQENDAGDLDLLRRFTAQGEQEALAALLTRHAHAVYRLALRYRGNPADAEDAVQTAFLQIVSAAATFRGASTVKTWILGFVVHACQRQEESTRRREAREHAAATRQDAAPPEAEDADLKEAVLQAVQRLPLHFRLPIWLHYYEGLRPQEVALTLAEPESTVRNQLARGLEKVRTMLAAEGVAVSAGSLGALIASIPQVHAPAALLTGLPGLLATAPAAATGAAVGTGKSATFLGSVSMKAAAAVLIVASAAGAVAYSQRGSADVPQQPAPEVSEPKGDDQGPPKGSAQAPLGSPECQPTPERMAGWRGDGTGCYTGAAPATEWNFHFKTILDELRCSGGKPKENDGTGGEALPFGRLMDWVALGPFPAEDAAAALNQEFIPHEADLQPSAGEAAGDKAWQAFRGAGENTNGISGAPGMELHLVYGELIKNVAYAATNLYSPRETKIRLHMAIPNGTKIWFNGAVLHNDLKPPYANVKDFDVTLKQGWNRILCKVLSGNSLYDHRVSPIWRIFIQAVPLEKPTDADRKNIQWMARMPGDTCSLPTIAGERIFVNAHYSTLLCLNKADGKVLWMRSNLFAEALSEEERNAIPIYKDKIAPGIAKLKEMDEQLPKELNALTPADQVAPVSTQAIEARLQARAKLERDLDTELERVDPKKFRSPTNQHLGTSNGTPITDGKHVWVVHGGGIYTGTMTVACYDYDGKRQWINGFLTNADEHGDHSTLALIGGKLILTAQAVARAFDPRTGALAWEAKLPGGKTGGGSPQGVKFGADEVIFVPTGDFLSPADGKPLAKLPALLTGSCFTQVVKDNVIYGNRSAYRISGNSASAIGVSQEYQIKDMFPGLKKLQGFMSGQIASPLVHEGLLYSVTEGGVLTVIDVAKGEVVYARVLKELHASISWVFNPGVCASPTLAGKYIFIAGDNGTVMVIQPGRTFQLVAVNTIDQTGGQTLSTPVFEGTRMYYRTPAYLYCIGEK